VCWVDVYIKLEQGESVVENCIWKILAQHSVVHVIPVSYSCCSWVSVISSILFLFALLVILAVGEQKPELVNCVRVILMSLPVFVSKPV